MENLDNTTIAALNPDINALQTDISTIKTDATNKAKNTQQCFNSIDLELTILKQFLAPDVIAATMTTQLPTVMPNELATLQSIHNFAAKKAMESVIQPTQASLIASTKLKV